MLEVVVRVQTSNRHKMQVCSL